MGSYDELVSGSGPELTPAMQARADELKALVPTPLPGTPVEIAAGELDWDRAELHEPVVADHPALVLAQAAERAQTQSATALANELLPVLGGKLLAYGLSLEAGEFGALLLGGRIDQPVEERLRALAETSFFLCALEGEASCRAWLVGSEPSFDDTAPIRALAAGRQAELLDAAKSFVSGGFS